MFGNCVSFCLSRAPCVMAVTVVWWLWSALVTFVLPCFSFFGLVCLLRAPVWNQWGWAWIGALQFISFAILGELLSLSELLWVRSIYLRVVIRIRQAVPEHSTVSGAQGGSKKCNSVSTMCYPCWDWWSWVISNLPYIALWHLVESWQLLTLLTGTLIVGLVYFLYSW